MNHDGFEEYGMKYSVIIPIYNAAATLRRCLDSLLDQPHEDVEILLINDGSTDESGEICRRYAQAHSCIRYFEKENGGVSSARNLGLDMAAGEYILFVDSDDYVTPDYFAVIDQTMKDRNPDMLMFGLQCFGSRNDLWQTGNFFCEDMLGIARFVREASYAYLYSNLMTRTFRREIIRREMLRFEEALSVGEDHTFIFAYTMHVKSMVSIGEVLYRYSGENAQSLSRRSRRNLTEQMLLVSRLMRQTLEKTDYPEQIRRIYRETVSWSHYRSAYSSCKELRKFGFSVRERRSRIREICKDYCAAGISPSGIRTWLIALPVLGRMSWVLDGLTSRSEFCRRLIH